MSLKPILSPQDHTQGDENAPVKIVEYGDFQCPFCGQAYFVIKEIQSVFGKQVQVAFRNFPLSELHEYAKIAAQAAEAASKQDKYWEMHDEIYEHQEQLNQDFLVSVAEKLDLDIKLFMEDFQSEAIKAKVEADFESGVRSGVNGTPTFFVNGERFDGGAIDLLQMLKDSSE